MIMFKTVHLMIQEKCCSRLAQRGLLESRRAEAKGPTSTAPCRYKDPENLPASAFLNQIWPSLLELTRLINPSNDPQCAFNWDSWP